MNLRVLDTDHLSLILRAIRKCIRGSHLLLLTLSQLPSSPLKSNYAAASLKSETPKPTMPS